MGMGGWNWGRLRAEGLNKWEFENGGGKGDEVRGAKGAWEWGKRVMGQKGNGSFGLRLEWGRGVENRGSGSLGLGY